MMRLMGRPPGGPKSASKWNWQLIAVKELGVVTWIWLGGRDSNPDNLLQRQMSYRWTTSQCQSQCDNRVRTTDYSIAAGARGRVEPTKITAGRRCRSSALGSGRS